MPNDLTSETASAKVEVLNRRVAELDRDVAALRVPSPPRSGLGTPRKSWLGPEQVSVIGAFLVLIGAAFSAATAYFSARESARQSYFASICNNATAVLLDETPNPALTAKQRTILMVESLKVQSRCGREIR